jgi:RNA polymerase sigma-70 factor (ECF subfamily)
MSKTVITFLTDEQLVDQYKTGNNNCLGILYERYYKKVYHKCLSYTKNPDVAFDLAQDILLKAFGKIPTFRGNSSFSTWLFVIACNHCVAHLRKNKSIHFENIDNYFNISDEDEDVEERVLYEQKEESLGYHLEEIAEIDKKMLVLKYQHNFSINDLQKEFKLNASAVKMRLQRARHKMEQNLNDHRLRMAI